MRLYKDFVESTNEIRRDLKEMGIRVTPKTYQDKNVQGNLDFETLEVQNYVYSVSQPKLRDLAPTQPWAEHEWGERLAGINRNHVNPGEAWKLRGGLWNQFLESNGRFSYTYGERFSKSAHVLRAIERLEHDPDSRQCWISVWDPNRDPLRIGGIRRVPCSLGYHVMIRQGTVQLTYIQRSADFATHFINDVWMAARLQDYISFQLGHPVGTFTHHIFSLHVFSKDVEGVF